MGAIVLTVTDAADDAAAASSDAPVGAPGASPGGQPGRARLALVPTGRPVTLGAGAERPRLRPTRFGRLTVTVVTLAVVIALGVGLTGQLASASGQGRPVTVESGQTLSEIAAVELPDVPVREGVVTLQLANNLSTDQVHTGQRLLVPVP